MSILQLLRVNLGRFFSALVAVLCLWASFAIAAPGVYRDRVEPTWSADGNRFCYRNDLPNGGREFVLVDAVKGERKLAFDHAKVAEKLSTLIGRKTTGGRLPITSLAFDKDPGTLILIGDGASRWRLNLETYALAKVTDGNVAAEGLSGELTPLKRLRPSRDSRVDSSITFVNRSADPVQLFWIDSAGGQKAYATVKPGQTYTQHTFAGHVWRVANAAGVTLGIFEGTEGGGQAIVRDKPADGANPASKPAALSPFIYETEERDDGGLPAEESEPSRVRSDTGVMQTVDDSVGSDLTYPADAPPASRRRGGDGRRTARGPNSPTAQFVLSEKNDNLFIRPKAGGDKLPLTSDGKAGDGYALDRVWWSPDGKYLVAMKVEAGQEHKVYTVESSPKDQVQPKLRTLNYLKPGDKIDHPRPRLFEAASRRWISIDESLFANPWSLDDVRWSADSARFTFVYNQRGHQALRLISVDAESGAAKAIVNEETKTFINYSGKFFLRWIGDNELIWMSERDGWNHLWLIDAKIGKVKSQITKGEWVVTGVDRVDEQKRQIWFRAGGVWPGQDPYYTHHCRVNFDGTGLVKLTAGDGDHAIQWSPGERFVIDTWSRVDQPPVTELRNADDGKLITPLESADATEALAARGGRWPERFTAKGRDGKTDIFGVIIYPRDYDAAKKYPVLENIYAGPQGFFTPKKFAISMGTKQRLADRGMIVVQCDGMGTSGRSKAFHDVCFKNLKDAGFEDRIAWIKAAAAKRPAMDLSRVGIYGGSAGGQNAMGALIWHHDFYKVAVADCGCHDNRMDKIWWNEQWMSWPVDESYAASSNVVNAGKMQGKLLLVFGEMDDNVDPASTLQVVNALQKADKDFELLIVVGGKHGAAETPYGSRKRTEFLVRNLVGQP